MTQSINPGRLLQDSFASVGRVYGAALILSLPSLIQALLTTFAGRESAIARIINFIYFFIILPWFTGAITIYIYQKLTERNITVGQALQLASKRILPLILGLLLVAIISVGGFILLIIPGIYLSMRLAFTTYPIALENCSATEGLKRSWELVKGRWWSVFFAAIGITLLLFFPIGLISGVIGATIQPPQGVIIAQCLAGIIGFLVTPILSVYFILLYMRLQATKTVDIQDI
ncbi:MAG: glycerophosphoryl diester phosphodiesterase membrane domain-containing protein [Cyanobacteriota bacterium]